MYISDIKFKNINPVGKIKAIASIVIDDMIAVNGIKIIEDSCGIFLGMPRRKENDTFVDIVHPISKEGRRILENTIINEYFMWVENADIPA